MSLKGIARATGRRVRRNRVAEVPGLTYPAVVTVSRSNQDGAAEKPVLLYRIPGSDEVFVFHYKESTTQTMAYICLGCKRFRPSKTTRIHVRDGSFLSNPAELRHLCRPKNWHEEIANRKIYEGVKEIRANVSQSRSAIAEYDNVLEALAKDSSLTEADKELIIGHIGSFQRKKSTFWKAIQSTKKKTAGQLSTCSAVSIQNQLNDLSTLPLSDVLRVLQMIQQNELIQTEADDCPSI